MPLKSSRRRNIPIHDPQHALKIRCTTGSSGACWCISVAASRAVVLGL
jgi:hypothetical protein